MKVFEITDAPQLPCESCMKQAYGEPGKLEWAYCKHNKAGTIRFSMGEIPGPWQTMSPITFDEWMGILNQYNANMERFLAQSKEVDEQLDKILQDLPDDRMVNS